MLESLKLNQQQAAKQLDIGARTLRRYMTGEMKIPRVLDYAVRWMVQENKAG